MKLTTIVLPLGVTIVIQAMVSLVAVTVPVLAPSAAPDLGISATYTGLFVALLYLGSMFSSLVSGTFINRYGPLRVSQGCLALAGTGLMLTPLNSTWAMIASAVVIGVGYGPVTPASSQILARSTPPKVRSLIFSLKQTGVPLGGVLAGALVPALVVSVGWRPGALLIGMATLALALVLHPLRARFDSTRDPNCPLSVRGATQPLQLVLRQPALVKLSAISFIYAGMQLCLFTYLVIYLTDDLGLSLIVAGFTLSAAQLAGTFGRVFWGLVADRCNCSGPLLGLLGILMAGGAAATGLASPLWPYGFLLIAVILYGATAIGWNGVYLAEAARVAPPDQVGTATGATLFFTYLGVVLGPALFGYTVSATRSYPAAFLLFAALTGGCGLYAVISYRRPGTSK